MTIARRNAYAIKIEQKEYGHAYGYSREPCNKRWAHTVDNQRSTMSVLRRHFLFTDTHFLFGPELNEYERLGILVASRALGGVRGVLISVRMRIFRSYFNCYSLAFL